MRKKLRLRLKAPIASCGIGERAQRRLTDYQPHVSALVGFLACCLGRDRDEDMEDLYDLEFFVHGPNPSEKFQDFHTVRDAMTNSGKPGRDAVTVRDYLSDVDFAIDVAGEASFIEGLAEAVKRPVWIPSLGRHCCALSAHPFEGVFPA